MAVRHQKPANPTMGGLLQDLLEKAIPDPVTPPDLADARPVAEDDQGRAQCTTCQAWVPFRDINVGAAGHFCGPCLRAQRRPDALPPVPENAKIGIKGGVLVVFALVALIVGMTIGLMARG
jgi:hypothetical protein